MGLMDKFKNLFTEEVEEEVEEEPIKKEVIQVEIPSPAARRSKQPEAEEKQEEVPVKEEPKQEEYKFPFFDDEDFSTIEKKEEPKEEKKPAYQPYQNKNYRKETKEVYSPQKEEKKVFKPTPIISPVYGILDKNYQKEDLKRKNERPRTYYNAKEATVDEIRNKAYGTLEDDIETTLFGRNRAIFEDEKKEEDPVDLVEENIKVDSEVTKTLEDNNITDDLIGERPRHVSTDTEPDLTELLEEELGKGQKEEEQKPHKISDSELFSMIDSMYQKGDKQW